MNQLARLTHAIAILTRAYHRRKTTGRPYGHLLTRCRRLSAAWLDERNHELSNPTR
jgi:hypothetical protein